MAAVQGQDHRGYDSQGRLQRPMGLRVLHGVVALGSLSVVVVAIWIGTRSPDSPDSVVTQSSVVSTTVQPVETTTPTNTAASSAPTTAAPTTTSVIDTDQETSTTDLATTEPPATTGIVLATIAGAAPLATSPGGDGTTLGAGDLVGLTGNLQVVAGSTWYEVNRGADTGWTPAAAIDLDGTNLDARPCGDIPAELPPTALAYQPGTVDGAADGIAAIEGHVSPACTRVVLYLGDGLGGDSAQLATAFPQGLSVVDVGGRVRVEMPVDLLVIPELELSSVPVSGGDALAITARRPDGRVAFNLDAGPARLKVSFLARPARVVLDLIRESDVAPGIGEGVAVNAQSIVDAREAGDGRDILVTGYARLLDGLGEIAFRRAPGDGGAPGSGLAIDAQFDGTTRAGSVLRSWYFYETPRVDGAWAEFSFTVGGLSEGSYEMFLGLGTQAPSDVAEPGLFLLLDVGSPG